MTQILKEDYTMSETEIKNTEPTQAPVDNVVTTESTDEVKTFTQADLDKVVADRIARERRKFEKKYEGIDPEYYNELSMKAEKERQDKLKAKGEFEKLLKETIEKKDGQIDQLMKQVKTIKVDGSLVDIAAKNRAVNPNQVATLLKDQVKLNEAGEVEVVDPKSGQTRYSEDGSHLGIDGLIKEFLTANQHFVAAGPSGAGSETKVGNAGSGEKFDISKLDMTKPSDRKIYQEYLDKTKSKY